MDINQITQLIIAIATLVGTVAALIPTLIALFKALKKIVKEKDWKTVMELAKVAIVDAEKSGKTGSEKKKYVIETVKKTSESLGITINDDDLISLGESIDDLVKWFNNMSKKK